jgi:hypothetical protein
VRILTDYLRDQGFEGPREKANGLIEQLRHRNWILCDRGADTYGFVHRTFLEYFCAMEIVHRFEKARSITFEQLRDEVFGLHWQDETWHEVLKLICGAIDARFSSQIIEFLFTQNILNDQSWEEYHEHVGIDDIDGGKYDLLKNLVIVDCFSEIKDMTCPQNLGVTILQSLQNVYVESGKISPSQYGVDDDDKISRFNILRGEVCNRIAQNFRDKADIFEWLKSCFYTGYVDFVGDLDVDISTLEAMIRYFADHPDIVSYLLGSLEHLSSDSGHVSAAVLDALGSNFKDDSRVFKKFINLSKEGFPDALLITGKYYAGHYEVLPLIDKYANSDDFILRMAALSSLVRYYPSTFESFTLVRSFLKDYPVGGFLKFSIMDGAIEKCINQIQVLELIKPYCNDENEVYARLRQAIMESFIKYHRTHPKTLELLHDRALNDPDDQLRTWAQAQLKLLEANP